MTTSIAIVIIAWIGLLVCTIGACWVIFDMKHEIGLLRTMVLNHDKSLAAAGELLDRYYASIYMPCGKERLSPVETMLLLTEYLGVEFYGGDGGPCYVSTEHDEVMKKAHKEVIKGEDIRVG